MVLVLCSYHISIAQQVDAVSVEMKWKAIWSTSQGLNWEIQELKSVTVFFWSTLKSQPGLEAVMVPAVQGGGRPLESNAGLSLRPASGRVSGFSKLLMFFFFFFPSQILGICKTSLLLQCTGPFHRPLTPWLPGAERPQWGLWDPTEIAFPSLRSFVISDQVFLLCKEESKKR